ncbi:right-handed parallel beta-helix repeat-containing protein [Leptospira interrogans]
MPTYYFSTSGSDANDGLTINTPKQTIAAFNALTLLVTDYVVFRGGDTFTGAMVIPASGSVLSDIMIGSYGIGRATFAPTNANTDAIKAVNKSFITINGINVTGPGIAGTGTGIYFSRTSAGTSQQISIKNIDVTLCGAAGIQIGGDAAGAGFTSCTIEDFVSASNRGEGLSIYGWEAGVRINSYITVQNGTVHDNGDDGAFIGSCDTGLIYNCTAYSNGALSNSGPVGFWTYDSDDVIIRSCISYNNTSSDTSDGGGFDIDGNCTGCIIEYCYAYGNKGAGFLLYNYAGAGVWDNNSVRFCIGENNCTNTVYGELHIGTNPDAGAMTNVHAYGNTFFNNRGSSNSVVAVTDASITGKIANNIFYGYGDTKLATVTGNSVLTFAGNNWFATSFSITWNSVAYTATSSGTGVLAYAAWQKATGQEKISGANVGFCVDPMLNYPGRGAAASYKLQPGSPMLAAGVDLAALFGLNVGPRDYFGSAIVAGSTTIGAGGPNSTTPVTF